MVSEGPCSYNIVDIRTILILGNMYQPRCNVVDFLYIRANFSKEKNKYEL